jgi:P-type Ca2+ transporter type 2C
LILSKPSFATKEEAGVSSLSVPLEALSPREVYAALKTGPSGLNSPEATSRLNHYGHNVLSEVHGKPLVLKLFANFTHLMALLLWVGGVVAFVAQMPQLGVAIWLVNLINGAFFFFPEYKT